MSDPTETLSTVNVVASTSLDRELTLDAVAADFEEANYDPDRFPGLVFTSREPKATSMIFRSGKIICTGAQSIAETETAVNLLFDQFREIGFDVSTAPEIVIENIVTTGDLGSQVNLHTAAIGFGLENIEYEPEQFPGLVYRPPGLETVVLIFGSGKVVIAGANSRADAEQAIEHVFEQLVALSLID